jgi:hypothetical protein
LRALLLADPRYRWLRLTGGVLLAAAVALVPILVLPPGQDPAGLAISQALICGVILGIGRQGIDLLLLRLSSLSLEL